MKIQGTTVKVTGQIPVIELTPALAEKLLATIDRDADPPVQRNLSELRVRGYAATMTAGKWLLQGDCLLVVNGILQNGQSRCAAVIASGVPIQIGYLERDEEKNGLKVINAVDMNRVRSVNDQIALTGQRYRNIAVPTANVLYRICTGLTKSVAVNNVLKFNATMKYFSYEVNEVSTRKYSDVGLNKAGILAAIAFAMRNHRESVTAFLEQYSSGENLTRSDHAYILRQYAISQNLKSSGHARQVSICLASLNVLSKYIRGVPIARMSESRDGFDFLFSENKIVCRKIAEICGEQIA